MLVPKKRKTSSKQNKTFSLLPETIAMLQAECARSGKPQTQILKEALENYIKKDSDLLNAIRAIIREELERNCSECEH